MSSSRLLPPLSELSANLELACFTSDFGHASFFGFALSAHDRNTSSEDLLSREHVLAALADLAEFFNGCGSGSREQYSFRRGDSDF